MTEFALVALAGAAAIALLLRSPAAAGGTRSSASSSLEGQLSVNEVSGLAARTVAEHGFDADPRILTTLAFVESSGNADVGVHPDGVSLGLMGLTMGVVRDNAGRGNLAFPATREAVLESAEASVYHAAAHLDWLRTFGGTRRSDEFVIRAYNRGVGGASAGLGADYLERFKAVRRRIGV